MDCAISGNCEVIRGCGHSRRRDGDDAGETTRLVSQKHRKELVDSTKGQSLLTRDDDVGPPRSIRRRDKKEEG